MVLHAPSVWEPFGFAQGKLRSLPALNKGQSEKSDWPFPFVGGLHSCYHPGLNAMNLIHPRG
jgi:hypothetical protein